MKKICLFSTILVLLFSLSGAKAISVLSGQNDMYVVAELGTTQSIYFVLQDVSKDINITASGEGSSWVSFGADGLQSYIVHPSLASILQAKISVPSDAQLEYYKVSVLADGSKIADLTIKTTLSQAEIRVLQSLADVNARINEINGRIDEKISDVNAGINLISGKINSTDDNIAAVAQSQKDIKQLEDERAKLSEKIQSMEAEKQIGLTGMLIGSEPMLFAIGFVSCLIVVGLLMNVRKIKRAVRDGYLR